MALSINNLSNSSYTKQAPPIVLDNDISFSGGTNYENGYIEFSLDTSTSFDNLTLITDASPSTVNSQISIFGDTVYIGNGTQAVVVGSIDPTFNGQNGQKLRINLSNDFENGNFNLGSPGSTTIPGWTSVNQQVKFGIDTIASLPTPIDTTIPANAPNADQNTAADPGSMTTVLDSTQNDGSGNSVRLTSSRITTAQGFDIVRGPYIYSNSTVNLSVGDQVSFEWQAQGGDDTYDVYGYIVDVKTGYIDTILNETGSSGSASTTWATKTITVSQAGEYKFVFVAGTYDFSGGTGAGTQLYIDDVTVTQAVPTVVNDTNLSTIARRVQYNNTSENPGTSKTLTVSVENNASQMASATATINITSNVDQIPTRLTKPSNDVFNITSQDVKTTLQIQLTGHSSQLVNELALFTVDDDKGTINGIAPGAEGYAKAALERSEVILSAIANTPNGFDPNNLSTLRQLNSGQNFRFLLVQDGSLDSVRNDPNSIGKLLFSSVSTQKITDLGDNSFSLGWKNSSGNSSTDFNDLVVKITQTNQKLHSISVLYSYF
ncbi:hypothetical protein [Nostoc commune]|uniref:hypothetical protein n=1 Tax=Nostoc commune TaxID=1178 RepID=UPI0018C5616E|nr:hypothetical protein [Nostoc commune]MBG1262974.1 hypothetical protein [Nostoc commune BAE]